MAMTNAFNIHVNRASTKVDAPNIFLSGLLVSIHADDNAGDIGRYGTPFWYTENVAIMNSDIRVAGKNVWNREEKVFQGKVTVIISPDRTWAPCAYKEANSRDNGTTKVTGVTQTDKTAVNKKSETWYTTNGKDPVRTKSKLYTGKSFVLRRNESGSDNIILKARTYQGGRASEVRTVKFRIIKTAQDYRKV